MGRYSRNISTYLQKKRHQLIDGGAIIERDWTTLGERHVIESGKRRVYSDSGFLFTENTRPGLKYRHGTDDWSEAYTADNLEPTVNDDVNTIKLPDGNDMRNYAYYGSSVELVRGSIENIVKWFPGKAWTTGEYVMRNEYSTSASRTDSYTLFNITHDGHHNYLVKFDLTEKIIRDTRYGQEAYEPNIYLIRNPFDLDFVQYGKVFSKYENSLRNVPGSYGRYYMKGCEILDYVPWSKPYDACDKDFTIIYEAYIKYAIAPSVSRYDEFYNDYGVDQDCPELIEELPVIQCVEFLSSETRYNEGRIYGLKYGNGVIWCTDIKGFTLTPVPNELYSYFDGLDGFERLLLTKKSDPIYSCTLRTPIKKNTNHYGYYIANRQYQFPAFGYCVLCDGVQFKAYVDSLYELATIMDELFTDNIWQNMTHESIINFDWTYKKDFEEGDEMDNIFGGTRMKDMLRIYGRFFDDIKRYIDGIKLKNCVTLDGVGCLPNAELSDKAALAGWEVYSTKLEDNTNIALSSDFVEENVTKRLSRWGATSLLHKVLDNAEPQTEIELAWNWDCDAQPKWYPGMSADRVTQNDVDNYFMRMLTLFGPHIFRKKGTKQSIEMTFGLFGLGDTDYEIKEQYYSVIPRRSDEIIYAYRKFDDDGESGIDFQEITSDDGRYMSFTDYIDGLVTPVNAQSPEYITLNGEHYELVGYTFKELCELVNEYKVYSKNYENDKMSGIPLQEIKINGEYFMVPYFTQDVIYDGDVQFQTNGGWGKFTSDILDYSPNLLSEYTETLPYTPILQKCVNLLEVNQFDVTSSRIYYVMDITDITDYTTDSDSLAVLSHYFKLIDVNNPQSFSSWSNIPERELIRVEREIVYYDEDGNPYTPEDYTGPEIVVPNDGEYDDYCNQIYIDDEDAEDEDATGYPLRPLFYGITIDDYELTQYLDTIIMDNLGNNPHTGRGKYDLGDEYKTYIQRPFYFAETHNGFSEEFITVMSKNVRFELKEYDGEKIVINNYEPTVIESETEDSESTNQYEYYLPNKMLVINFKNFSSNLYRYFKNVIFKYVTQVIPSTTILIIT